MQSLKRGAESDREMKCEYCNENEALVKEHVNPKTLGGDFSKRNIADSCISCNALKRNYPFKTKNQVRQYLKFKKKNNLWGPASYSIWRHLSPRLRLPIYILPRKMARDEFFRMIENISEIKK